MLNEDCSIILADSLVVAVMPKPPAKHLQEDDDEDEDLVRINLLGCTFINIYSCHLKQVLLPGITFCVLDVQRFKIPQSSSRWKRRIIFFLREKLRVPGMLVFEFK